VDFALAQPRAERHPAGLLIVVALHVLVAGAMLTARLRSGPEVTAPPPLTKIETPPPEVVPPHDLPEPPKALLHPLVAPVPEVVVDRVEATVQAAPQAVAAAAPAAPATVARGDGGASDAPRVAARSVRIDAGNKSCRPRYPHVAEREGVTGITKLRITIDATGHVTGATLLEASGSQRQNRNMDQAAIEALSECPVTAGNDEFGRPVGGTVDINYKWTIF
jgi:protein TonB